MITTVYKSILRHLRPHTYYEYTESYVDGENIKSIAASGTIQLASFPLSGRDLKYLPEGAYTRQDKKFYEIGSGTVQPKSILTIENNKYQIDSDNNRNFEGGFTVYLGKRITDDSIY